MVKIQKATTGHGRMPSRGRHVVTRGVVINVWYPEEEKRDGVLGAARGGPRIQTIAVDVLTYGSSHRTFLTRIPVAQPRHALVDHDLWVPRPTSRNVSANETLRLPETNEIDEDRLARADPRDLDGDHVLVEMLDGDTHQAFVRCDMLPHPRARYRLERDADLARSERLRGVVTTIDGDGNFTIDTTRANSGDLDADANETPALDAEHGRVDLLVNHNAELNIRGTDDEGGDEKFHLRIKDGELLVRLANGESMLITGEGAGTVTTLGDGGFSAVQSEILASLWTQLELYLNTHTHPSGVGPTGPPSPPGPVPAPGYTAAGDPASTKLKFPGG